MKMVGGCGKLYEVVKYIHEHIDEHITVSELSNKFGYSKWYFCDLFKRFTGTTVLEYIRNYRIQLAALDILNNEKCSDVAAKYGYETQSGFNKAFLKEFGCLPREFKKKSFQYHMDYKERRKNMFHVSDRCSVLKDEAVNKKTINKRIFPIRNFLFVEGIENYAKQGKEGNHSILAAGICHALENAPAIIQDGELLVGYNYADTPFTDWQLPDACEDHRNILLECGFSNERIDRYLACRKDNHYMRTYDYAPAPQLSETDRQLEEEWSAIGRCIADNHSVIGFEDVLKLGFDGLIERIDTYEKNNGKSELYESMKAICRSACINAEKYADKAKELQGAPDLDEKSISELKQIELVCRKVPRKPAETLWEAIQSLWFSHIVSTWEDTINANSLGRLDQILYPYYRHDIDNGILTKEEAFELVCCLWIKLYRDYDVQQSCVGGCLSDGSSAVNDLSYLMLDATEELDFIRCLSVRFSPDTDKKFIKRALEVVGHVQKGIPFFFNDDVMIPALTSKGIALEDARDYTQIGCVETVIPGKSNPHAVSGETNLLKSVEYFFANGESMFNPEYKTGIKTGPLDSFTDYKKLEAAVFEQVRYIIDHSCKKVALWTKAAEKNSVKPFKSLLTHNCIESNTDFNNHGAKYDYYQIMLGGVPNLADSLMVLKKLVYQNKKYTLQDFYLQMKDDFPNEAFRQECIHKVAKFGNDIDEVDEIAAKIIDFSCDVLEEAEEKYKLSFHAQPFTFLWMVDHGAHTAATPDGRKRGEIIAYSVSPMQGRDFNGFTALLNSLSKLPTKRCPGTTSAIVEIDPKLFTDNNIDRFVDILISSAKMGLSNVQFNTIDAETLLDAQQNPDKYNNLAVRVSGFSQKFNLLSKELQDHIIGRTKHQCL